MRLTASARRGLSIPNPFWIRLPKNGGAVHLHVEVHNSVIAECSQIARSKSCRLHDEALGAASILPPKSNFVHRSPHPHRPGPRHIPPPPGACNRKTPRPTGVSSRGRRVIIQLPLFSWKRRCTLISGLVARREISVAPSSSVGLARSTLSPGF